MPRRSIREQSASAYNTIAMLLDVDHFFGEHQGRLGPVLIFLCVGLSPILVYGYYGLYMFIPLWLFILGFSFYILRVALMTLGREKDRLRNFKRQLNDIFSLTYDMIRIKTVHDDGGVEYINGTLEYFIVTYNGSCDNKQARAQQIKKFLNSAVGDFSYDFYVQNIIEAQTLSNRYSKVKLFSDTDAARDFIDIIDHNRNTVHKSSLLTKTIFVVKGKRSDWKEISTNIEGALRSTSARAFKTAYLVRDKEEIEVIISRDIDGLIHLDDMLRKKYRTGNYRGSKVVCYDDSETKQEELGMLQSEKADFHITYEENIY